MLNKVQKSETRKVPRLRFPDFSSIWGEKKLGSTAVFLKGKGISKDDISENGINKCIRYGELYTTYNEIIKDVKSRTNISNEDSLLSKENDILTPSSGETALYIAKVSCVKEDNVLLGGDINVMRLGKDQSGEFFAYYLSNFKKRNIAKLAQGNSVVHLYASQLKNLKITLPSFNEQQKIAEFLELIDSLSTDLIEQKKSLESYKNGIMQNLFQQEIRFKDEDNKAFPKWESKKLSSFLVERNENAPKSDQYPLMAFVAYKGVAPKGERYNREFLVSDRDNKNYKRTEYGDFIYSSNNLETGSIGLNRYGSASISPVYGIFKIAESCDYQFMGSYLVRKSFISKMIRFRQGVV